MKHYVTACAIVLLGCPKDEHVPSVTIDAAPVSSESFPTPPPKPVASTPIVKPPACRAIAVTGSIKDADAGTPLAIGAPLSEGVLSLDKDAKLTVKATESGREIGFEGPALVRACVAGDPEQWLLQGAILVTPGSGEKPGSEEWIVTSNGIIRFASAMLRIKTEKDHVTVKVMNGSASVFVPKVGQWTDATPTAPADLPPPENIAALVDSCGSVAKEARDLGAKVTAAGANLADLAPKHVEARKKARATCAVARVAATAKGEKALVLKAETADAEWRVIP